MTAKKTETKEVTIDDSNAIPSFIKVKKVITLPLLKFVTNKAIYVTIEGAMFKGREMPETKMEAATLCNCINLETGEQVQIIVSAVLESTFNEEYEDNSYVGKSFMIKKLPKAKSDAKYFPYSLAEVEVEA